MFELVSAMFCVSLSKLYSSQEDAFAPDSNSISFFSAALAIDEIKQKMIRKYRTDDPLRLVSNAQRRRSQRGAPFVLMFERQRETQKVRSVGCRSAADC